MMDPLRLRQIEKDVSSTEVWMKDTKLPAMEVYVRELLELVAQLQTKNATLCAWQKAAAEERIVLRERLNRAEKVVVAAQNYMWTRTPQQSGLLGDIPTSYMPSVESQQFCEDALAAALTESQEPG